MNDTNKQSWWSRMFGGDGPSPDANETTDTSPPGAPLPAGPEDWSRLRAEVELLRSTLREAGEEIDRLESEAREGLLARRRSDAQMADLHESLESETKRANALKQDLARERVARRRDSEKIAKLEGELAKAEEQRVRLETQNASISTLKLRCRSAEEAGKRTARDLAAVRRLLDRFMRVGAASLETCVGGRLGLPLSLAWERIGVSDEPTSRRSAKGSTTARLARHLESTGLCRLSSQAVEGARFDLEFTLGKAPDTAVDLQHIATWLCGYVAAWLAADSGCRVRVGTPQISDSGPSFGAAFAGDPTT